MKRLQHIFIPCQGDTFEAIDWTRPEDSFQTRHDLEMMVRLARLDIPVGEWEAYGNLL